MKLRHLILAIVLLGTVWLSFSEDAEGVIEPIERKTESKSENVHQATTFVQSEKIKEPLILSLQSRATIFEVANQDGSTKLFGSHSWNPPPPPPPKSPPPPPPSAPPLPFTYLGKQKEDSKWLVFLARDDRTYIVAEDTTIDDAYRINSITPPVLSLIYLPMNQVQTLPIGGAD
ncbi:hypothetical protein D3C72_344550 [compost metagenome]